MEIKRLGSDHLVVTHDGIASARPMMLTAFGCIVAVILAAFFSGSLLSLVIVLIVGGFLLLMLWRSSARTAAVFDRERGTLASTHTRSGEIVGEDDVALADVSLVIVEASSGGTGTARGRQLSLRPSLLAGDKIIPLTYRAFETGPRPAEVAEQIREFLGQPKENLITDSVHAMARYGERVQPAVRLARLGLGLDRPEAAEMVTRIRNAE